VLDPRDWFTTAHNPPRGGGFQGRAPSDAAIAKLYVDDEYMEENLVEGSGRVFCVETCV
jgi:hypothetical protein